MTNETIPLLKRLKINTVAAPDIGLVENWYTKWLGYNVCERGEISGDLASSWGTPAMAGNPYLLMQPESGVDVFMRVVAIDEVPEYKPMTTLGWNAFELIIDDVYKLHGKLVNSPFKIIGEPAPLDGELNFIHAMQVLGPAGEAIYLTCDVTREPDSLLPLPGSFVDRPFIVILAGNGVDTMQTYYCEKFLMKREEDMKTPIGVIADAQSLPKDHMFDMGFMGLSQVGNFIEYDGYDDTCGPRPCHSGQLPPGCSSVSFSVDSLESMDLDYVGEEISGPGMAYGGGRCRTARGPVGELIEIIEGP
ncbi:MAG: hypothetical protein ACJZ9F_08600 [Rhodospirillaceae bacterium]